MISWTQTVSPQTSSAFAKTVTAFSWIPGIGSITQSFFTSIIASWNLTESITEKSATSGTLGAQNASGRSITVYGTTNSTETAASQRTVTSRSTQQIRTSTTATQAYLTRATGSVTRTATRWTTATQTQGEKTFETFITETYATTTQSTTASGFLVNTIDATASVGAVIATPLSATVYQANTRNSAEVLWWAQRSRATDAAAMQLATQVAMSGFRFTAMPRTETVVFAIVNASESQIYTFPESTTTLNVHSASTQSVTATTAFNFIVPGESYSTVKTVRADLFQNITHIVKTSQISTIYGEPEQVTTVVPSIRTKPSFVLDTSFEVSETYATTMTTQAPAHRTSSSSSSATFQNTTYVSFAGTVPVGSGLITESAFTSEAVSRTSIVRAEAGVATFRGQASRKRVVLEGVANGASSIAGYYVAEDLPGFLLDCDVSVHQSVVSALPSTFTVYQISGEDEETEYAAAGSATVSSSSGTYLMEGETETQSFSIVPAGQAMTRQGAITESLVLCEDLGLSQTVIDEVASGIYRNRFGVTFATTGHTLSYSEPQNSSELWEPLTFIAPTTAAVGDVVWSVPRNRSSTDF